MLKRDDRPKRVTETLDNGTFKHTFPDLEPHHTWFERFHGEGDEWRITQHASIFTRRFPKHDLVIDRVNPDRWGAVYRGKHYKGVCMIACEDGSVISGSIDAVPDEILDNLEAWGFTVNAS